MYPVILRLEDKKVVVAGGGTIACRKLKGLMETKAVIEVVAPEINVEIQELVKQNKVIWIQKKIEKEDYKEAFLIIAATNNPEVNRSISHGVASNQLINVVDSSSSGNFIMPATARQGKLILSVSTSGASPKLAKKIRDRLHGEYRYYESYLDFLDECRRVIKKLEESEDGKLQALEEIMDEKYLTSPDLRDGVLQRLRQSLN